MADEQLSSTTKKKVLIIRFSSLGDIALTFPVVNFLKSHNFEVHYLTKDSFSDFIKLNKNCDSVKSVSNNIRFNDLINYVKNNFNNNEFDYVFDLHNNIRSFLVKLILKRKNNYNIYTISKQRLKTILNFIVKDRASKIFSFYCDLKINLNLNLVIQKLEYYKFDQNIYFTQYNLISNYPYKDYILISPDSLWRQKEWDLNKYLEVAKKLIDLNYNVIWTASKNISKIPDDYGINLTGKTNYEQLVSLVKNAKLVLSNDSGIMHIAESLNVKSVAIFGPTSRGLGFAPYLSSSLVIENDLWCRPCSKSGKLCYRPIRKNICLKNIQTEQVLNGIKQKMEQI